jgi:hypothetical protein
MTEELKFIEDQRPWEQVSFVLSGTTTPSNCVDELEASDADYPLRPT